MGGLVLRTDQSRRFGREVVKWKRKKGRKPEEHVKAQFTRRGRGREDEHNRWRECEEEGEEKALERKIERKNQLERRRTEKRTEKRKW